jgi:HEAT repeat protein
VCDSLLSLTEDPEASVRIVAASALGEQKECQDPRIVAKLVSLLQDTDSEVVRAALSGLSSYIRHDPSSDENVIEPLILAASTSSDDLVRMNAKTELTNLLVRVPPAWQDRITTALAEVDAQQRPRVENVKPTNTNF